MHDSWSVPADHSLCYSSVATGRIYVYWAEYYYVVEPVPGSVGDKYGTYLMTTKCVDT